MSDQTSPKRPYRVKNITGVRFGRLVAIRSIGISVRGDAMWEFQCDCGKFVQHPAHYVKSGDTKSCGCYRRDCHTTHGSHKHPIYRVWQCMKSRCERPKTQYFHNYGGRGIKVLWPSFEKFSEDMLSTWEPGLTIERKDNNGHYCKENCRWATRKDQARNTRRNYRIEFRGETLSIAEWADRLGLNYGTLYARVAKYGWPIERALTYVN